MGLPYYACNVGEKTYTSLKMDWKLGIEEVKSVEEAAVYWMIAIEEPDWRITELAFENDGCSIEALASFIQYNADLCFKGMEKAACEYYDPEKHGLHGLAVFGRAFAYNSYQQGGMLKMHDALLSAMESISKEDWMAMYDPSENMYFERTGVHNYLHAAASALCQGGRDSGLKDHQVRTKLFKQLDRLFPPSLAQEAPAILCLSSIYNYLATEKEFARKEEDFIKIFSQMADRFRQYIFEHMPNIQNHMKNTL